MEKGKDLERELLSLDGRGYPGYKSLKGEYDFGSFILCIDHVQSDPYAPPSKLRVKAKLSTTGITAEMVKTRAERIAISDFLTRTLYQVFQRERGIFMDACGQEVVERSSVIVGESGIEIRFLAEFPAAGRRILGKAAKELLIDKLSAGIKNIQPLSATLNRNLLGHIATFLEQEEIRAWIKKEHLVAFVANGAILPRESGISDRPMKNAKSFVSPKSLQMSLTLRDGKTIEGMGIREGITLIVGGGYHGKSTLLRAIERGVYNHIKGDGREYVITQSDATKIRAEDGRSVQGVDISQFINHLPQKKDTKCFVSENASGSTSQAANVVEAIEVGAGTLLVDEDTSATNFMIRDHRMQTLVSKEKEPITPFVEKIKALYQRQKISTILVVGGSGDYFDAADCVIMLDEYMPLDVTDLAKKIAKGDGRRITESEEFLLPRQRKILKKSFSKAGREDRVRAKGLCTVLYGRESIDLSALEQLVDPEQTSALAVLFDYAKDKILVRDECITKVADKVYQKLEEVGLEGIAPYTSYPGNLVLPRKQEFLAMINRYRGLCVQIIENE